jgi:hypothetical protein
MMTRMKMINVHVMAFCCRFNNQKIPRKLFDISSCKIFYGLFTYT